MLGNRRANESVPRDGNGMIGFQLHLLDSKAQAITDMNLERNEVVSRTFAAELIITDILGCSDSVSKAQVENRGKRLSMLKPGNTDLGGRGGPYSDSNTNTTYQKKKEIKVALTALFDAMLVVGVKVAVTIRGTRTTLDLVLDPEAPEPTQGTTENDRLFRMDLNFVEGLENQSKGKFKWTEDGFKLKIRDREWVWKAEDEDDDDAEMEDEEGEIWSEGAKVGLRRTWERIDDTINGVNIEYEEEEAEESSEGDESDDDEEYRGRM